MVVSGHPSEALARQPEGTDRALEGRRWYPNLPKEEDGEQAENSPLPGWEAKCGE